MTENLAVIQETMGRLVSPKVHKKLLMYENAILNAKKEVVPQGQSLLNALNACQINVERM